jgi:hypothetical protein
MKETIKEKKSFLFSFSLHSLWLFFMFKNFSWNKEKFNYFVIQKEKRKNFPKLNFSSPHCYSMWSFFENVEDWKKRKMRKNGILISFGNKWEWENEKKERKISNIRISYNEDVQWIIIFVFDFLFFFFVVFCFVSFQTKITLRWYWFLFYIQKKFPSSLTSHSNDE